MLQEYSEWIIQFARTNPQWTIPLVALLAFGESIAFVSLVLPFWSILVALGALLSNTDTDFISILFAASIGAALGDWLSYSIGYRYRNQISDIWPFTQHPNLLPRGHALFEKWGAAAIWLARFSGPLRASVPIVAGIVGMDWKRFQLANWPSAFLWAGVLLVFGDIVGKFIGFAARYLG
ncbi:DedA family protein [bacterium]|nr:DedA family protein [bacterium]